MNMSKNDNILYHGATIQVAEPLTHVGRSAVDFGPGFYVTNDKEQAINWSVTKASRHRNSKAIVNVYSIDMEEFLEDNKYKVKIFPEYNIEWLNFIAHSRKQQKPWLGYDWIEGGIANDHVISTVDAYIDGFMTAEMAMDKLVNERLHHQICISNQEIIDRYIRFVESFEVETK